MWKWAEIKTACPRFSLIIYVWRSKRYTIWGRESILYFIIRRPCHHILNTRLTNNTTVTDSTMEWLQPSFFVFIERQGKERQMLRSCNWCLWLSGLGGCVTCKHCTAPLCEILNEWVASNRILVFAQRFLGSPRGKHCNSLEGIVWRKVFLTSDKKILERDYRFFAKGVFFQGKSKFLFEKLCNV